MTTDTLLTEAADALDERANAIFQAADKFGDLIPPSRASAEQEKANRMLSLARQLREREAKAEGLALIGFTDRYAITIASVQSPRFDRPIYAALDGESRG